MEIQGKILYLVLLAIAITSLAFLVIIETLVYTLLVKAVIYGSLSISVKPMLN